MTALLFESNRADEVEDWPSRIDQVFDDFRARAGGSGEIGRLDGPEFLADLLEWVLAGYLALLGRGRAHPRAGGRDARRRARRWI